MALPPLFHLLASSAPHAASDGRVLGIPFLYLAIFGGTMLVSWLVSSTLKRRFSEYSGTPFPMTGADVARKMLADHGITDVEVLSAPGQLTDHYDPRNKTVNLSEPVHSLPSVAAAAVAAHECGHAVQHARAYRWLTFRSKMVPAVSIASKMMNFLLIFFLIGSVAMKTPWLLLAYIGCLAAVTLFSIVTLPVEFDASRRALAWLGKSGLSASMQQDQARKALFWAAMTYVVAALSSIAMLAYYLYLFFGRRD